MSMYLRRPRGWAYHIEVELDAIIHTMGAREKSPRRRGCFAVNPAAVAYRRCGSRFTLEQSLRQLGHMLTFEFRDVFELALSDSHQAMIQQSWLLQCVLNHNPRTWRLATKATWPSSLISVYPSARKMRLRLLPRYLQAFWLLPLVWLPAPAHSLDFLATSVYCNQIHWPLPDYLDCRPDSCCPSLPELIMWVPILFC